MIHLLGGASCQVGALRVFPLCHQQLQLYDSDELVIDITRVSCSQCQQRWHDVKRNEHWFSVRADEERERNKPMPTPEDFVCEGHERIAAEVERKRRDVAVTTALEEPPF